jgi:glycosyltransferase involved in cell wall biosynthesis
MEVCVLVVDDASEDETRKIVQGHEHLVVSNMVNRGGGAALRLGYDISRKAGARICVTMDADGQHKPDEIQKLVLPISNGQYDFVIGSRILGKREKDSLIRLVGVYVFGKIISLLLGKRITDPSSGFRAFRMDAMGDIDLYEDQYHTSELIIEAVKKGMRIGEVPITMLRRKYGKSKKGLDWRYGLRFARTIVTAWWR